METQLLSPVVFESGSSSSRIPIDPGFYSSIVAPLPSAAWFCIVSESRSSLGHLWPDKAAPPPRSPTLHPHYGMHINDSLIIHGLFLIAFVFLCCVKQQKNGS